MSMSNKWQTALDAISDVADKRIATQIMGILFESLADVEYGVTGRPMDDNFGYRVATASDKMQYEITVTNCSFVSMRMISSKLSRHSHVRDVVVTHHSPSRGECRNLTIVLTMLSNNAPRKTPAVWTPPDKTLVESEGVSGLVVPRGSKDDAIAIIDAVVGLCSGHWSPEFFSAETRTALTGKPRVFRIDARPVVSFAMSFYSYLEEEVGTDADGQPLIQNVVLAPYTFQDQYTLQIAVYCNEQMPSAPAVSRTPRDPRLGIHSRSSAPRRGADRRSWFGKVLGMFTGEHKDAE